MKCENLQFNLSIYLDDCLSAEDRSAVDAHLEICPLCRQNLADFQSLRNNLRSLGRPEISGNVLASIRNRVAASAESKRLIFSISETEDFSEWLRKRLLPYSVGAAASLLFGLTLLWTLLSAAYIPDQRNEIARLETPVKSSVLVANSNAADFNQTRDFNLNAPEFADASFSVSAKSPSLNPKGALAALTKSIVRGDMKDDELVVVADVFGNGLARIAEVVEPSSDIRAVRELEKALKNDPNYAPFMPASFDRRSETVRVIFKINRVDVNTKTASDSISK